MATTNASDGQISSAAQARDGVNGRNRAKVVSPPVPDTRARMQRSVADDEARIGEPVSYAHGHLETHRDPRPARGRKMTARTPLVRTDDFEAVLFDLDGVLTTARAMHAAAWKRTIDEFLLAWDARHGVTRPVSIRRLGLRDPCRWEAAPRRSSGLSARSWDRAARR